MPKHTFSNVGELTERIDAYFKYIEGECQSADLTDTKTESKTRQTVWFREPEPATFTGLAMFLGFESKQDFELYEKKGRYASILKRGRLRIEVIYERKLHQQSSAAGAIFALKAMGWNEKAETKTDTTPDLKNVTIEIKESGPKTAETEKLVIL